MPVEGPAPGRMLTLSAKGRKHVVGQSFEGL